MIVLARPVAAAMNSVVLPALLLAIGLGVVAIQFDIAAQLGLQATSSGPQTVTIVPGSFTYRAEGHFLRDGNPVDAPMIEATMAEPLVIMKYQVSSSDYRICVDDGACALAQPSHIGQGNIPVTGVNYEDATAYAAWLSSRTGQTWVLPTDRQWAFAAGSRFADDGLELAEGSSNPAVRWLADYEKEAARDSGGGPLPLELGSFDENENGVADIAGNVWEWTQTCHRRVHVDGTGAVLSEVPACGIMVLDGRHRTPMSFFIRDAKSGGCSVGIPPDNLGFRLVRQPNWRERLLALIGWTAV